LGGKSKRRVVKRDGEKNFEKSIKEKNQAKEGKKNAKEDPSIESAKSAEEIGGI